MTFGGMGVGLAKMMEGVSGGALAGAKTEMAYDASRAKAAADAGYKNARLANETSRLQMMQSRYDQTAEIQRQKMELETRRADLSRIKIAYDLSKDQPNPGEYFKAVQKKLNPDGDVLEMAMEDQTDVISLSWPGSKASPGYKIKGHRSDVEKMMSAALANPEKTSEIMKMATGTGVLSVEQVPYKPTAVDAVYARDAVKKNEAAVPKAPKVSDYVAGIKAIFLKYKMPTSGLDSLVQLAATYGDEKARDKAKSLSNSSQTTAYDVIKKYTQSEDPSVRSQASEDLRAIDSSYAKINGMLGVSSSKKSTGDIKKYGPVPGFKRIKGLPDVTYEAVRDTMRQNPSIRSFDDALKRIRMSRGGQ